MTTSDKPAPAPLRDAREVPDVKSIALRWWLRYCDRALDDPFLPGAEAVEGAIREALKADRAARPDVALRELLEEGARLVEAFATAIHIEPLEAWARRAREAVPKKPVDEP